MKGQVLDYSIQRNEGVISSADGGRFVFFGTEWKDDKQPMRGMWVDFEPHNANAIAVYREVSPAGQPTRIERKSKAAATLWAVFFGGFGAHKFYMGSWGWGLVYLLTSWMLIPFILAPIEWIRYVCLTDEEFHAKVNGYPNGKLGAFSFLW